MLWDKSRTAAQKMAQSSILEKKFSISQASEDTTIDSMAKIPSNESDTSADQGTTGQFSSWFYTASRLQKKAKNLKSKGDIDGAIESTKIVLELQRAARAKKEQSKRSFTKEQLQVAGTLVSLAQLVLIKDATKEAEGYFKEADELYKASGKTKDEDCVQDISRQLERLRWQQKTSNQRKQ